MTSKTKRPAAILWTLNEATSRGRRQRETYAIVRVYEDRGYSDEPAVIRPGDLRAVVKATSRREALETWGRTEEAKDGMRRCVDTILVVMVLEDFSMSEAVSRAKLAQSDGRLYYEPAILDNNGRPVRWCY